MNHTSMFHPSRLFEGLIYWDGLLTMRQKKLAHVIRSSAVLLMCGLFSLGVWNCEDPISEPNPNTAPDTRLANVPVNDTIALYIHLGVIPEQTLFWTGDDPDGFVIAYRYRWTDSSRAGVIQGPSTVILNITQLGGTSLDTLIRVGEDPIKGTPTSFFRLYDFLATMDPDDIGTIQTIQDSLATGRPFAVPYRTGVVPGDSIVGAEPLENEAPTKGTFIFDSPADSNLHTFRVSSIDNDDMEDPTPAIKHFWTLRSPGPTALINSVPADSVYVLQYPTERNPGLTFTFGGIDPSTDQRDYSWAVDDTSNWSPWSPEAQAVVTARDFPDTTNPHRFYLRARNRWGVLSPTVDTPFVAFVPPIDDPTWAKRTLIINNSRIVAVTFPPLPPPPDTTEVNRFYSDVMDSIGKGGEFDIWTTTTPRPNLPGSAPFPTRTVLARYTSVLLLSEQELPIFGVGARTNINSSKQALLREYLDIGGKLIFSGTPNIRTTIGGYDTWARDIFHIVSTSVIEFTQNEDLDFIGAKGNGAFGYPDVALDPARLPLADSGAIRNIALSFPRGFGQTISYFVSKTHSVGFENAPLGIRYLAPPPIPPNPRETYSVVHFAFPLYYVMKGDVIASLRKAFEDIKELD